MKAVWNGQTLAESDDVIEHAGYTYFPRESVKMDVLSIAEREGSDLSCPNGVQFYNIDIEGEHGERQAWAYEKPRSSFPVPQMFAFWKDVELVD